MAEATYFCPRCHAPLSSKVDAGGIAWQCGACGGHALGLGVLRKKIGVKRSAELLNQAFTTSSRDGCACPMCARQMASVTTTVDGNEIHLDLCQPCGFIWFDASEFEVIPAGPPPPHVLGEIDMGKMSPEAREKLAMIEVTKMSEDAHAQDPTLAGDWKTIPAALGLPVEIDPSELKRTPWVTYTVGALITLVSVVAFFNLRPAIDHYGLIPAETWRNHGLTLFSSFFLHGNILHLAGNLYFLFLCGRLVEEDLGPWLTLLLLLIADQTGNLLHIMGDPDGTIPCIGASGGISGLLAYYALKFPHIRLSMLWGYGRWWSWIQFRASTAFFIWIALQFLGAWEQLHRIGNVSSLAHLGGVIPGVIFWWIYRGKTSTAAPMSPFDVIIR